MDSGTKATESAAHAQRHGQIARAVRATGGVTMLSRMGGLVRDVVIGRMFGDTAVGSAFAFAFAVPNMFRRLFGEGALSAAFVPEYSEAVREGRSDATGLHESNQLASLTIVALAAVTTAATAIIEAALLLVLLLGTHDAERAMTIKLVMVMLPFMPLICCAAILAGMLQVHGKYGAAASGPLLLNAFIVITGAYFILTGQLGGEWAAYAIGAATVLSGVTQVLWFLRLLRPHVRWTMAYQSARQRGAAMLKRFIPVAIGLGTLQLNTLLDSLIAMWPILVGPTLLGRVYPLDDASNVIISLTARFYQLPLGVFGIAVATAVFPLLAQHAKEPAHFLDTLRRGVRLSLLVGVPASVGLVLVREDAIAVLYGHGKTGWSSESIDRAAAVLMGFAAGVWAYGLNHVFTRAMYAKKDTLTPMRVAIAMVALNLALNLTLIWWLKEAGLAWATSVSAIVQCCTLGLILRVRTRREQGMVEASLVDRAMIVGIAKILVATAFMGACVWLTQAGLGHARLGALGAWGSQCVRLLTCVGVGGAAFVLSAWVMRSHELRWLLHRPARVSNAAGSSTDAQAPIDAGE